MRFLSAAIALALLAACEGYVLDIPGAPDLDTVLPGADAGQPGADAAASADSGEPADAALETPALDAGSAPDADPTVDAEIAAGPDAGAAPSQDSGSVTDPVAGPDAGTVPAQDSGSVTEPIAGADAQASAGPDAGQPVQTPADAGTVVVADPSARVVYTSDRTLSPLTAEVVSHLRDVAQSGSGLRSNVFMKVGDSITVNSNFMGCFDGDVTGAAPSWEFNVLLDGRSELADSILRFRSTQVGGTTPYSRASLAAKVGAAASFPLAGSPAPLESEFAATLPLYAVVMYGSNDIGLGGSASYSLVDKLAPYEAALRATVDELLAKGVVPILTTMPPRQDDSQYLWIVPNFTAVERAIAQGRQIPLVDFNRELMALPPPHGMGGDGVHPSAQSYNSACWFRPEDLGYGYNVRNLATIQALHQLDRVFVGGETAIDPPAPTMVGKGSAAEPFVVDALPYTDMRDTAQATSSALTGYSSCGGASAPGPEFLYKVELNRTTRLRAIVLDQQQNRVGVSLLTSPTSAGTCLASAPRMIATTLAAGTYYFAVDTLGATGAEYTFTVVECDPADARCN